MVKKFFAWAIDTQSYEGHGYLGRYWWFKGKSHNIPEHLEDCRVALFNTRRIARENLRYMKTQEYVPFPKAKVVKVEIIIRPVKKGMEKSCIEQQFEDESRAEMCEPDSKDEEDEG